MIIILNALPLVEEKKKVSDHFLRWRRVRESVVCVYRGATVSSDRMMAVLLPTIFAYSATIVVVYL